MKTLKVPWELRTRPVLETGGFTFDVVLRTEGRAVPLRSSVKMEEDGVLSTTPDCPVEFGRPGKQNVKTGVRIAFDKADPTDLLMARRFLDECLSLYGTQPK